MGLTPLVRARSCRWSFVISSPSVNPSVRRTPAGAARYSRRCMSADAPAPARSPRRGDRRRRLGRSAAARQARLRRRLRRRELLGTVVTRGRWAYPVGVAMHVVNGALFGAVYAARRALAARAAPARGPAPALAEHLGDLAARPASSRLHPAADEFPRLWGSARARPGDLAAPAVRHRARRGRGAG